MGISVVMCFVLQVYLPLIWQNPFMDYGSIPLEGNEGGGVL
jgi:hypothetical protein